MRPRYTRPALADLDSILDYIATHSPQGAARVHARIETIANLLLSHPRIGVWTEDPSIRRINTSPYPYLIFYEVADDEIIIHAVSMVRAIRPECPVRAGKTRLAFVAAGPCAALPVSLIITVTEVGGRG